MVLKVRLVLKFSLVQMKVFSIVLDFDKRSTCLLSVKPFRHHEFCAWRWWRFVFVCFFFAIFACFVQEYTEEFRDISKGKSKESVPTGIMLINQRPVGEDSHVCFWFYFLFIPSSLFPSLKPPLVKTKHRKSLCSLFLLQSIIFV